MTRLFLEVDNVVWHVCLCVSRIQSLCQELESSFYDGMFPWQQLKQHDTASLLKLFIRELPHPLLTVEYLSAFIAVNSMYTICSRSIPLITRDLQPHYETMNWKTCIKHLRVRVFACVRMFTELPTKKQQLQALNLLVLLLPEPNRDTLKVDGHLVSNVLNVAFSSQ